MESDWQTPIKQKMKSAGLSLNFDPFKSKENSVSEQKNRSFRARITIKKLLENEAEKNEELAEDNSLVEKQIKSLIALLVEKDEKIKELQNSKKDKRKSQEIASGIFLNKIKMIFKKTLATGMNGLIDHWLRKSLIFSDIKLKGLKLGRYFNRMLYRKNQVFLKLVLRDLSSLKNTLQRNLRVYFKLITENKNIDKCKESAKKIIRFIGNKISSKKHLKSVFDIWKRKSFSVKTTQKKTLQKFISLRLKNLLKNILKKRLNLFIYCSTEYFIETKKNSHKVYLSKYRNRSLKEIQISVISLFIRKTFLKDLRKYFFLWKKPKFHYSSTLFILQNFLSRLISKRFVLLTKSLKSYKLPSALKSVFLSSIRSIFFTLSSSSSFLKTLQSKSEISAKYESFLKQKDCQETTTHQLSLFETENSLISHKITQINSEISALDLSISETDSQAQLLTEKTATYLKQLDVFSLNTSQITSKYSQELAALQAKLKKQNEYIETAGSKLLQLKGKHSSISQENLSIYNRNEVLKQNMELLGSKYKKITEELRPKNDPKYDVQLLSKTLTLLEDEIKNLNSIFKAETLELKNARQELISKSEATDLQKTEIINYEESLETLLTEINELESEFHEASEAKDQKLQEINQEITGLKEKINKSKEDLEVIKSQIKETSLKAKNSGKISEDYQAHNRNLEISKKKLASLKESVSSSTQTLGFLQKENSEIKTLIRLKKEEFDKKRIENSLIENKIALAEISLQESQKQTKFRKKTKEELEHYVKTLEQQVLRLSDTLSKQNSQDISNYNSENAALAQKVERLERELEFFNVETAQRRREVAEVKPEIENYRIILAAMEEKIAENEAKIRETELETEKIKTEGKILKERFICLSHNFK